MKQKRGIRDINRKTYSFIFKTVTVFCLILAVNKGLAQDPIVMYSDYISYKRPSEDWTSKEPVGVTKTIMLIESQNEILINYEEKITTTWYGEGKDGKSFFWKGTSINGLNVDVSMFVKADEVILDIHYPSISHRHFCKFSD